MTTMKKITKEQIEQYVEDVGTFDKEHRKYSSFYCWSTHTFTQEDIERLREEDNVDASDFLNVRVIRSGMWDDSNGTEWHSTDCCKVEQVQVFIPERVIPAHYITKEQVEEFHPVWG